MHQALDNRLIEVTTVVKLSLGGGKGGRFLRFHLRLFFTIIFSATTRTGARGTRLSNNIVFGNKRFSSSFANGPIKFKFQYNYAIVENLKNRLNLPFGKNLNL